MAALNYLSVAFQHKE